MHTSRTCSRRRRSHPHPLRHCRYRYRRHGRIAVVGKEKEGCPRPHPRRRQRSIACAMNCAEWRSRCPGISGNQITRTTNGLPHHIYSPSSHHTHPGWPHVAVWPPRCLARFGCNSMYASRTLFIEGPSFGESRN